MSSLLDTVQIASPCSAPWESMPGDDRARFCSECKLHVFNLSAMTQEEAETLIRQKEGRLCARYFKRSDGKIITSDCAEAIRTRRVATVCGLVLAMLIGMVLWLEMFSALERKSGSSWLRKYEPFRTVLAWLAPEAVTTFSTVSMGAICDVNPSVNPAPPAPGSGD